MMLKRFFTSIINEFSCIINQESKNTRISIVIILFVGTLLSFYSFYFFLSNKIFLIGSDAFYYLSIADSILNNGEVKTLSTIPSYPVKSPQNGIVFVHMILSLLGIGAKGRILSIVVFHYLLYLSGVYPLYKIARMSGLNKGLPLVSLLSVYLGAWHIYRLNLIAYNDGIFNSLIIWLLYFIIKLACDNDADNPLFLVSRSVITRLVFIGLMVMLLIHFRLNVVLVVGSAVLSALAIRNYRLTFWFSSICALLLLSFFAVYIFVEVQRFENIGQKYFFPLLGAFGIDTIKLQLWKILPRLVAGASIITNPLATLCFTVFPLSMMYYGIKGIMDKEFSRVFIAGVCLTGLWFTMSFKTARVIWYTIPFIYLIIFNIKKIRLVGYFIVLIVFLQSFQQFFIGFSRPNGSSQLWLHIYENKISLPDDALLLSRDRQHPYFFLGNRVFLGTESWQEVRKKIAAPDIFLPKVSWNLIKEKRNIYAFGPNSYLDRAFSQMENTVSKNEYTVSVNRLTPELNKFKGWALLEFSIHNKSSK